MNIFWLIAVVCGIGALGGLLNSVIAGELHWPRFDNRARVWRPGWVGHVLTGAGAAFVNWTLNGSTLDFFKITPADLHFTGQQAGAALVIGIAGGRYLTGVGQRRILRQELDEEREVRQTVAAAASPRTSRAPGKARTHGNTPGTGT